MATIQEISEQIREAGLGAETKTPEILNGGTADGVPDESFSPDALAQGTRHEMEHTTDEAAAAEIAKDHLAEDPEYYSKLEKAKLMGVDYAVYRLMAASK